MDLHSYTYQATTDSEDTHCVNCSKWVILYCVITSTVLMCGAILGGPGAWAMTGATGAGAKVILGPCCSVRWGVRQSHHRTITLARSTVVRTPPQEMSNVWL